MIERTIIETLIALLPSAAIVEEIPWLSQPILVPQDLTAPMWLTLTLLPLFLPLAVLPGMAFEWMGNWMCSSGFKISLPNNKVCLHGKVGADGRIDEEISPE